MIDLPPTPACLADMLWGGGAPFEVRDDGDLDDRYGKRVRLLGAVRDVLYELRTDARWEGAITAVASCTDEPEWAQECMRKFEVGPVGSGVCIKDVMQLEEIRKGNKSAPTHTHIYICVCDTLRRALAEPPALFALPVPQAGAPDEPRRGGRDRARGDDLLRQRARQLPRAHICMYVCARTY